VAAGRKIKHPLLGQIKDDAAPRTVGQQIETRHDDPLVPSRNPGIDALIDGHELRITDVVAAGDIEERVLLIGGIVTDAADGDLARLERKFLRGDGRHVKCHRRSDSSDRRPNQIRSHHAYPTDTRRMLIAPPGL